MRFLFIPFLLITQNVLHAQEEIPVIPSERLASIVDHSAFGDITLFKGELYIVFREGIGHSPAHEPYLDGSLRVMKMLPDDTWNTVTKIERNGVDLRDPHFAISPSGTLMITCGGSYYHDGKIRQWHTYAMESKDGSSWSIPVPVSGIPGSNWFFRLTWKDGVGYCAANICKLDVQTKTVDIQNRRLVVYMTTDGFNYESLRELNVPNTLAPCEASLHFDKNEEWNILIRSANGRDYKGTIAMADQSFNSVEYYPVEKKLQGPNMIELEDGTKIVGTRELPDERKDDRTATSFYRLNKDKTLTKIFEVPSDGDTSYPGFEIFDDHLYIMYYSGHEYELTGHRSSIYLSKIPLDQLKLLLK